MLNERDGHGDVYGQLSLNHVAVHHSSSLGGDELLRQFWQIEEPPSEQSLTVEECTVVDHFLQMSLFAKNQFSEIRVVKQNYFEAGHAQAVPLPDLNKAVHKVFYLPMHCVWKESSSTTKVRAVFDAFVKTSTGVSLNDTLLTRPMVHSSLSWCPSLSHALNSRCQQDVPNGFSSWFRWGPTPLFIEKHPSWVSKGLLHDTCQLWCICLIICCP